jgi:thiol-disulfide isomerase/thioredoxin
MTGAVHVPAQAAARPPPSFAPRSRHLQRCGDADCTCGCKDGNEVPTVVREALAAPGSPLDEPTRVAMEQRLGHRFGRVRIHTDHRAAESARALGARAYTVGANVVFAQDRFAPRTPEGRGLLAHELVHVVQQDNGAASPPAARGPVTLREDPSDERVAEDAARALLDGGGVPTILRSVGGLQRADTDAGAGRSRSSTGSAAAPARDCFHAVSGEEIDALLQSRTVTVIDLWADWCGPCKMLTADLEEICKTYRASPPAAPVRFFSVDVDDPANKAISDRFKSVPQLLIYYGPTLDQRFDYRPEFKTTKLAIADAVDKAARSGAERGMWKGAKIGAVVGGIAGLATGIGLAFAGVLTGGLGLLAVAGLAAGGVLGGGLLGGLIGRFAGWLADKRDIRGGARRGAFEADALIRRRFGGDIPRGTPPLHGAPVRAVPHAELRELFRCRHDEDASPDIVGWTDTGPPPPERIAAADEPVCASGQQLEHATPERPVIYYARDKPDATVVIHEGLHAYAHPHFTSQLRNRVAEATTEYFTRQIASDVSAPSSSAYENWLPEIRQLVGKIGEPALRAAYFRGDFGPANRILGKCGLEAWAQELMVFMDSNAAAVLQGPPADRCANVIVYPETDIPEHVGP